MQYVGIALIGVAGVDFQPLHGRDGGGGGNAGGVAHQFIELVVSQVTAFKVFFPVQIDGKIIDVDTVFFRCFLGDITAGVGHNGKFAFHRCAPFSHFHWYFVSCPWVSRSAKSH